MKTLHKSYPIFLRTFIILFFAFPLLSFTNPEIFGIPFVGREMATEDSFSPGSSIQVNNLHDPKEIFPDSKAQMFQQKELRDRALFMGSNANRSLVIPEAAPTISEIRISNARDVVFSVSWVSDLSTSGYVEYGSSQALGSTAYDIRGSSYEGETHYVNIPGLNPSTTYYFDIISGGIRDDNNGQHYSLTTGPTLSIPNPDTACGQVFLEDGSSPADGVIVIFQLKDNDGSGSSGSSAPLAALTESGGWWNITLSNARVDSLDAYFSYSSPGDILEIQANGARNGNAELSINLGDNCPASSVTLSRNLNNKYYLPLIIG